MKSLLLIEDDTFFRKFYATKLTENNYNVEVAVDGIEGLKKLKANKFDLVMLDMVMPKMDGFSVLSERAKDKVLRSIPVLVFSTLGQDTDIEKAKQLGANDYINKTFYNFDELLGKIKTLIGQ